MHASPSQLSKLQLQRDVSRIQRWMISVIDKRKQMAAKTITGEPLLMITTPTREQGPASANPTCVTGTYALYTTTHVCIGMPHSTSRPCLQSCSTA